jgi:hypothetical protein
MLVLIIAACQKKKSPPPADFAPYWSIKQYAQDQWTTYGGQPITFLRVEEINGKVDSTYAHADTLEWGSILKAFFETDISDTVFVDQYSFSQFEDADHSAHYLLYEAKSPDLYTRKLLITADPLTMHIDGIYVEAQKKSDWGRTDVKLLYEPLKLIQIQQYEYPLAGKPKTNVVAYRFML